MELPSLSQLLAAVTGANLKTAVLAFAVAYVIAAVFVFRSSWPFGWMGGGAGRSSAWSKQKAKDTKSEEESEVFPEPMAKGDLTVPELKLHDGSNSLLPVLLAAKGVIYDVTRGRDFYGKGGPYNGFAGIDCSRALAKVSLDAKDLNDDVTDLYAAERDVLNDWVRKFEDKYPVVGVLGGGAFDKSS